MRFKGSILASLLATFICLSAVVSFALSTPVGVYGHVTVNGAATSGVAVSLSGGQSTSTDGSGFYQFGINSGSSYTVTASYNGHSASKSFTANGDTQVDLNIAYTTSTPTATPSPSSSPTTPPGGNGGSSGNVGSSGSSGGSNGNVGSTGSRGYATVTPTPLPETDNSITNASAAAIAPTVAPTIAPTVLPTSTPTPTPVPTPTATAVPVSGLNDSFPWWIVALLGALGVIVVAAYFFLMRRH